MKMPCGSENCQCLQCKDDVLQILVGCRYGQPHCNHEDCQEPVYPCETCNSSVPDAFIVAFE